MDDEHFIGSYEKYGRERNPSLRKIKITFKFNLISSYGISSRLVKITVSSKGSLTILSKVDLVVVLSRTAGSAQNLDPQHPGPAWKVTISTRPYLSLSIIVNYILYLY